MREYYKKIDKSFFKSGITIPKDNIADFIFETPVPLGTSRELIVTWKKKEYKAKLCHVNRKNGNVKNFV